MNKPMRRGAKTKELAIELGIAQMAQVEVVGAAQSVEDANERHIAACNAMARSAAKSRDMMDRLRRKIEVTPLSPKDLASRVYPGRKYQ